MTQRWQAPYYAREVEPATLISRFTIALLSSLLGGMSVGYTLTREARILAASAAALGALFYAYRTWLAHRDYKEHCEAHRHRVERRLNSRGHGAQGEQLTDDNLQMTAFG